MFVDEFDGLLTKTAQWQVGQGQIELVPDCAGLELETEAAHFGGGNWQIKMGKSKGNVGKWRELEWSIHLFGVVDLF